jgi:azurin
MKNKFAIIFILLVTSLSAQMTKALTEADFYTLKSLPIPEKIQLEVGGLATLPDGRIAVSTRRGEIWLVENAYMDGGTQPHYRLFASGLHEILGLAYRNGSFYCSQRGELTKLTDTNQDGEADEYKTIYRYDLSGNYHEYAYGPIFDKDGDMYVTLNVSWVGFGDALAKWHGWLLKIKEDGTMTPIATGLRSPAGFGLNTEGDIFYAENQGDWVGSGRVTHLVKGDFAGNAGGLNWTKESESPIKLTKEDLKAVDNGQPMHEAIKTVKEMKLPAVWFPHGLMGISTADILQDTTNGAFGPFGGQYFVADQGHSKVMRMTLEKVNGQYQGACYPFREGWASGLLRLAWGIDGSMFGGMTSRGWASTGKDLFALQRMEWTGKLPFEMKNIVAKSDGFEIEFTMPVDKASAQNAANYEFSNFTYKYHHNYGSPIINQGSCNVKGIIVSDDGLKVRVVLDAIKEGYIHEVKLKDVKSKDGISLLHNFAYYTMNNIPSGDKAQLTENQKVKAVTSQHAGGHHGDMAHTPMPNKKVKKGKVEASPKHLNTMPASWGEPDEVILLSTKPGLKYDKELIQVKAGSKIKLVFNNNDDMQHNVVITNPNEANNMGAKALDLGLKGPDMQYVPNNKNVLFHTNVIEPGTSETIYFVVPEKVGDYHFVCTYPGHYAAMQGILRVVKD